MDETSLSKIFSKNVNQINSNHNNKVKKSKRNIKSRSLNKYVHKSIKNTRKNNNITLNGLNYYLRSQYQLDLSISELHDNFSKYPVMPDLYRYYCNWIDNSEKNKIIAKQLKNKKILCSLLCSRSNKYLQFTRQRAFRIPKYLNDGLNFLVKQCKNKGTKYSSIAKLLDGIENVTFSKSSVSLLLLIGVLKPDNKLKSDLLSYVTKDRANYKKLIRSKELTPYTNKYLNHTTFSYPNNIVLLFNDAGVYLMKQFLSKNKVDNLSKFNKKIKHSCSNVQYFSGGLYENIAQYTANPIDLICWKLQDVIFY